MKLLKLCTLLSIAVLICIEVYQITKLTRVVESALVNKRINNVESKEQSYLWCMNRCIRQMARHHSPIDDYSRCINTCNQTDNEGNKKKLIF
jgi:type II secretory pathway pseudopilin PulG